MPDHVFNLDRIGAGLPVSAARHDIECAAGDGAMVVTAPPGTGKTTLVPALIADVLRRRTTHGDTCGPGRVLVTQPRRVAVRAAAHRLAELDGSPVGGPVGFTVRGERQVSRDTVVEALTPGVLLRRLLNDPELQGVGAVVLDEVHERSVDGDLLLGMIAEVRALREDLIVVAMSATLDADAIATLLGERSAPAPIVRVASALHPLEIEYQPFAGSRLGVHGVTSEYLSHVARTAVAARTRAGCDALLFLPGAREVDTVVREIRASAAGEELEVLALHGRVSSREQDRAVRGRAADAPARIVVSTALAESSLTVPGVRLVIDAGLSREVRRDRGRDMAGLVTVSASRASAEQRAGRAARQGPGRAVRVFSESEYAHMPAASAPEIASADLVDAALLLAAWGTPEARGLALLTRPPAAAIEAASQTLHALELTNAAGAITHEGSRVAALPVGVREARALLAGAVMCGRTEAAEVVAAYSGDHREPGADLARLLRDLRAGVTPGAARWRSETQRLSRLVPREIEPMSQPRAAAPQRVGSLVALARPEWVARRVAEHSRSYLLASGTRAALPETSSLIGQEWIAVREVQLGAGRAADGTGAVIRLAAPITEAEALRICDAFLTEQRVTSIVEGRVRVRQERRLGAIPLSSVTVTATPEDTAPALITHVREHGLNTLTWSESAQSLRSRLSLLHRELGAPWPAVDDDALLGSMASWLHPEIRGATRLTGGLAAVDTAAALRRLFPWPEAAQLDTLVPERLPVPSGATARISYPDAGDPRALPVVAVKLQEVFGLAATPRVVQGRIPVVFHLLSPARRPLAVTGDLASFWDGAYQEVRKEMRGRYPKHPWPEDPWTAPATAHTKRRTERR